MTIMSYVNDNALYLVLNATMIAALAVVAGVAATREVLRLWSWRDDMLCGLIEPRVARTTDGEATLLATTCGVLILCASLVIVAATAGVTAHVQAAISIHAAQAEDTQRRR